MPQQLGHGMDIRPPSFSSNWQPYGADRENGNRKTFWRRHKRAKAADRCAPASFRVKTKPAAFVDKAITVWTHQANLCECENPDARNHRPGTRVVWQTPARNKYGMSDVPRVLREPGQSGRLAIEILRAVGARIAIQPASRLPASARANFQSRLTVISAMPN